MALDLASLAGGGGLPGLQSTATSGAYGAPVNIGTPAALSNGASWDFDQPAPYLVAGALFVAYLLLSKKRR